MNEVTRVLSAVEQGEPHAAEQLLPLVHYEPRPLAAQRLAQEKPGLTPPATAPVHQGSTSGWPKALGQELTGKTLFTGFAQMIGTPLYVFPEQAGCTRRSGRAATSAPHGWGSWRGSILARASPSRHWPGLSSTPGTPQRPSRRCGCCAGIV